MKKSKHILLLFIIGFISINFLSAQKKVLILTETAGYDHNTRAATYTMVQELGDANGFLVDNTSTSTGYFTEAKLAEYAAILFMNNTGDFLDESEQTAFENYIGNGGGALFAHAAADAEYDWPFYHQLLGATFQDHRYGIFTNDLIIVDKTNIATSFLPGNTWTRQEEYYYFTSSNPSHLPIVDPGTNPNINVLLEVDRDPDIYHPISWYQYYGGGRSWYSGFGHYSNYFEDNYVKQHFLGGILFVIGEYGFTKASYSYSASNMTVDFDASESNGTITNYAWNFGDGNAASGQTANHTYALEGDYTVTLTVTDDEGATDDTSLVISVPYNNPPVANAGDDISIPFPGNSTTIQGSGSDPDGTIESYSWMQVSGPSAATLSNENTANLSVSDMIEGTYEFELTVTDNGGATASDMVEVTVRGELSIACSDTSSNGDIIWSFTEGDNPIMTVEGTNVSFGTYVYLFYSVNAPAGGGANGGTDQGDNTFTYNITASVGDVVNFYIVYSLAAGGQRQSDPFSHTLVAFCGSSNELPVASFTSSATDLTVDFDASASSDTDGSIASYAWDLGDGNSASGQTASHTYAAPGDYTIVLTVTDNEGAVSIDSKVVSVDVVTLLDVANNGTSVEIFPNPVIGNDIYISLGEYNNLPYTVDIISVTGKVLMHYEYNNSSATQKIQIPKAIDSGIFYVKYTDSNRILCKKMIKMN